MKTMTLIDLVKGWKTAIEQAHDESLEGEHSSARGILREVRDEMLDLIHGDIDDGMCPAIGFGECSVKPVGPGGAMQCQWCGEAPSPSEAG